MTLNTSSGLFADVSAGRRRIMRAIRSCDTKPERQLRSLLHAAGYRFRKNVRGLPGRPDVVFSARKKAIFVHGCFWHAHEKCSGAFVPKTRTKYWKAKLDRNVARDAENLAALKSAGWQIKVVWECELDELIEKPRRLLSFLDHPTCGQIQKFPSRNKDVR